jgi:hypothetical protein
VSDSAAGSQEEEKRFVPWNGLMNRYSDKAELMRRLQARTALDFFRSHEPQKGFPTTDKLTQSIRKYGLKIGETLIEWLEPGGQLCDEEFLRIAKTDIRAVMSRIVHQWTEKSEKINLPNKHKFQSMVRAAASIAQKECIELLEIHSVKQSISKLRTTNPGKSKNGGTSRSSSRASKGRGSPGPKGPRKATLARRLAIKFLSNQGLTGIEACRHLRTMNIPLPSKKLRLIYREKNWDEWFQHDSQAFYRQWSADLNRG